MKNINKYKMLDTRINNLKLSSRFISLLFISIYHFKGFAQNPAPGKSQTRPIVIQNATIHIGNGVVIPNGEIAFDKGIITYVGPTTKNFPNNANLIDAKGGEVYPGIISMANHLGLSDVESIPAVNDYREIGSINPNIRTLVAFNTDSDVIPTVRGNGVLISQATPTGGMVAGQSSVFNLDGWNWQDAVLKADDGIWLNWPPFTNRTLSFETFTFINSKNEKRKEAIQELDKLLNDAKAYIQNKSARNLKLEPLEGLFDGTKVWYIGADMAKEIIEAVQFAKEHGIKKIAIYSGLQAIDCADFLKENNIPVILNNTHETPSRNDDAVYSNYSMPYELQKAGVDVVISYGGLGWRTRNLPYLAGTAVGFGINKEDALKMITLNPAKLIGIDSKVGTLEKGKLATLVLSKGDLLDMRTSEVKMAFIQGKEVNLGDKQKALYQKFSENISK
jgi:imidazolonepropionase-like amidohydrolase